MSVSNSFATEITNSQHSGQRSEQNIELVNIHEKCIVSQRVEDKYLDVLEHAKNVAKTNDV
ncbi:MAG TPA: hypothetical protein VE134_04040, partial [Methanomicrobiales archaeon]|nr:hypothetical protein [Methanomicrobiales archaeon]